MSLPGRRQTLRGTQGSHTMGYLQGRAVAVHQGVESALESVNISFVSPSGPENRITHSNGKTDSFVVRVGPCRATGRRAGYGPYTGSDFTQTTIAEGPVDDTVVVVPTARQPLNSGGRSEPTIVTMRFTRRSPLIRVTVVDADNHDVPIVGAIVEVSGNKRAPTDANGQFVSNPLPMTVDAHVKP